MGRIKELQAKLEKEGLNEAEQKELDELLADVEEITTKADEDNEEKALDEAAKKLADKAVEEAESRLSKSIDALTAKLDKGLEISDDAKIEVTNSPKFIVDSKYGKKSIEELEDIKVAMPERKAKGKQITEVSQKTVNFVQAWLTGDVQKLQVLVEGTGSKGGFVVPEEFANMLVEDIVDATVMRQLATVETTNTDTYHVPNIAHRPKAAWRSEAAVKNTSTVDFGENVFTPYSLATIIPLSNELVADASMGVGGSIVNKVAELAATAIGVVEDKAFFVGSGTGQPTGMSTYTLGTLAVAAGGTDAQRADAIKQTWVRLPQGYRARGAWVMNSTTLERVVTLKDSQGNYLTSRLGDSPQLTLMGRPIYEQNDIAGGTAYFGDFSYYMIVDRQGIQVDTSTEATVGSQSAFERNLTFVRVEKRVDGELTLTNAIRSVTGLGTP